MNLELTEVVITCKTEEVKNQLIERLQSGPKLFVRKGIRLNYSDAIVTHAEPVLRGWVVPTTSVILVVGEFPPVANVDFDPFLRKQLRMVSFASIFFVKFNLKSFLTKWLQTRDTPIVYRWSYFQKYSKVLEQMIQQCGRPNNRQTQSTLLLSGKHGCGKRLIAQLAAFNAGIYVSEIDCYQLWSEAAGTSEKKIVNSFQKARRVGPCLFLLRNVEVLGKNPTSGDNDLRVISQFKDAIEEGSGDKWPFLIVGTTTNLDSVPTELLSCFDRTLEIEVPVEAERMEVVRLLLTAIPCANVDQIDCRSIARRTPGFYLADFESLIDEVKWVSYNRVIRESHGESALSPRQKELLIVQSGFEVLQRDIDAALKLVLSRRSEAIGAPRIPEVHWEDVGGLTDVKNDIIDTIQLTIECPQLFAAGLKRSGILLHGPPGCGKTLLAKAVATECQLSFFSVKGPELLNMYVGQSEKNIREVFERGRIAAPCVIFFDELDALAPNRGRSGDSGGVMDRVVSQLLAELDGLGSSADVFVIGATNRPDLIDPALLRPGRFDKVVYVGVGKTVEARLSVLKAASRKMKLAADVNLEEIVERCEPNMSGAEFYSLCSTAATNAIARVISQIESTGTRDWNTNGNAPGVTVSREDFLGALTD